MTITTTFESAARDLRDRLTLSRLLASLLVAAAATLLLAIALGLAIARANDGRVLPGVRAGSVDLGGLSRQQATAKLSAAYTSLSSGKITVRTPAGSDVISYAEIGRAADVAAMTDAALGIGRDGDLISQSLDALRTAFAGTSVPPAVRIDPAALATRLRASTRANDVLARNASVAATSTGFALTKSRPGRGLDEQAVGASIVARLSSPDAPSAIDVSADDIVVAPAVSDAAAQNALTEATRIVADVPLAMGSQTWTIKAATIHRAISFVALPDGTYGPFVDPVAIGNAVASLTASIARPAVEPTIVADKTGAPFSASGGKNGLSVDVASTTQHVLQYLAARESGASAAAPQIATSIIEPKLTQSQAGKALASAKKLSSWTVYFQPGVANGFGANIRLPAQYINGTLVAPGEQFSFWSGVGPITPARGFRMGGVIVNGHSDFTGAIGGGICSASTSLFNAAMRAGLQIDERHNHAYYITRYPAGLDATVFEDGSQVSDMKFTNDTANPILIRGRSTATSVTFEIWGVPDGRTVKVVQGAKTGYTYAHTTTVNVTTLPVGTSNETEYPADGFNIWAYRTVTSAGGAVLHSDSWYSHYITVNGIIQVGAPATPSPAPSQSPGSSGSPSPAPSRTSAASRTPSPSPHP